MNKSLVSVILPTYNRLDLLQLAIESIRAQSYSNIEIVVIDDYSTDETVNFLTEYSKRDQRIRVIRNDKNIGFVRSLNKGIKEARGEYIARLDDDDSWCDSKKLEKQVEFLVNHPEYVLTGGGIIRVDEYGKEIARQHFPENDEEIRKTILIADPFVHTSVLFRKKDVEKVGGYDENLDYAQDWDLWMKLGRLGKYYNFPDYFVRYLQSSQNRSNMNMRHHLWLNLVVRKRYQNDFPNFWKGYIIGWISYFFSFIPIRQRVSPFFLRIKEWIIR